MNINEVIARNIINALRESNKTQQELSDVLGMTNKAVSSMLNGAQMISATALCKIANFLCVTVDSLVQVNEKVVYSPIDGILGKVNTPEGKEGIKIAEQLMNIYSYHHKFQTEEFKKKCNSVWSD